MKTKITTILIAITVLLQAGAWELYGMGRDSAGTAGAQFLKLGAGSRETGMGNAAVGKSGDANAVYWNPAGLSGVGIQSLSFMHVNWMDDINYEWFSYARRVDEKGVIGFGVQYMGYGSIKETNEVGAKIGDFSPSDTAVTMSYARAIESIDVGGSVKYISSRIKRSADTVAFDAGVHYRLSESKVDLGMAVTNAGPGLKYVAEETPLPMAVKCGLGYEVSGNWDTVIDLVVPNDNEVNLGIGTEYRYKMISTRIGYNTRTKDIGGLSGLTFGAGFSFGEFRIDYSYEPYDYMGDSHRVSVIWNSKGKNEKSTEK